MRRATSVALRLHVRCVLAAGLVMLAACRPAVPTALETDWDPDSVADAFARPVAALVWPFATRAVLVGPDGSLDDGTVRLSLEPSADGVVASRPLRIASEHRW